MSETSQIKNLPRPGTYVKVSSPDTGEYFIGRVLNWYGPLLRLGENMVTSECTLLLKTGSSNKNLLIDASLCEEMPDSSERQMLERIFNLS